jgi:hypothetical protein
MNAPAPPGKGNGALLHAPISKLTGLRGAYYFSPIVQARWLKGLLRLLQWPFGFVFWALERAIANIEDFIANRSAASP